MEASFDAARYTNQPRQHWVSLLPDDSDDSDTELDLDFGDDPLITEPHTPLIFNFSPPLRPENPLRCLSSIPPAALSPALDRAPFIPQKEPQQQQQQQLSCSFRETELIFAPMPFRGRSYRPRPLFGSVGGESVEFEVVGVGLSTRRPGDDVPGLFALDKDTFGAGAGADSDVGLDATLFDQEHYNTLFRKLQTLQSSQADNGTDDDLSSSPPPPPTQLVVKVDGADASSLFSPSSSSASSGPEDGMWSPPKQRSALPTPMSSREPSPHRPLGRCLE